MQHDQICDYQDYKQFLKDKIASFPKAGHGVARKLSEHLGVNSVVISQVLSADKHFTIEQSLKVADFFFLKPAEKDYFVLMVSQERAGTHELKTYYQTKMNHIKNEVLSIKEHFAQARELTEPEKAQFYSNWYYSGIRLAVSLPDYRTVDSISERFQIPEEKVREILQFLLHVGLIEEKDGLFRAGSRFTMITRESPFVNNHRRNWRLKALENLTSPGADTVHMSAPFGLSKDNYEFVHREILAFVERISKEIQGGVAEELACLNVDWFKF